MLCFALYFKNDDLKKSHILYVHMYSLYTEQYLKYHHFFCFCLRGRYIHTVGGEICIYYFWFLLDHLLVTIGSLVWMYAITLLTVDFVAA